MNVKTNKPATKPEAGNPPKKLVPRQAAAEAAMPGEAVATPAVDVAVAPVPEAAKAPASKSEKAAKAVKAVPVAKTKRARKPTKVQETVAKHQKVLAEALAEAQAIKYDQPKVAKPKASNGKAVAKEASKSSAKVAKPKKVKLVRDSYAMPDAEYARIGALKKRLAALGSEVKKSELLRAGIATLAGMGDGDLQAVMAKVERIKTGRPSKK